MLNGVINVYKEKGYTSHDVVAKMRGIFRQKKIGHTGTLDPDAVGVLPVCLGNATKLCDLLTDRSKEYRAVLRLGITTDTQDMSGEILSRIPEQSTPRNHSSRPSMIYSIIWLRLLSQAGSPDQCSVPCLRLPLSPHSTFR